MKKLFDICISEEDQRNSGFALHLPACVRAKIINIIYQRNFFMYALEKDHVFGDIKHPSLENLILLSEEELLKVPKLGPTYVQHIKTALDQMGRKLKPHD